MRQKSVPEKAPAEQVVKDIRPNNPIQSMSGGHLAHAAVVA